MTRDRMQAVAGMSTRQKLTIGAVIIVLLIILYQIYGLFKDTSAPPPVRTAPRVEMSAATPAGMTVQDSKPVPAPLPTAAMQPMTGEQAELQRQQQQNESRYVTAVNQLQLLRVEKDIAETNKAIASARLDTVTAQKGIVTLLQPPPPPATPETYARGLINPTPAATVTTTTTTESPPVVITPPPVEVNYTVISVSQLQQKWNAVLGFQGKLFSVMVGDVLPPDGSTVITINRNGVILQKNGVKRKVSLVPII